MAVVNAEAELLRAAGAGADEPPRRAARAPAPARPAGGRCGPALALAGAVAVLVLGVLGGVLGTRRCDDERRAPWWPRSRRRRAT